MEESSTGLESTTRRISNAIVGTMATEGEQVSKKMSSGGNLTLYVGQRNFIDFHARGNTVDGVVTVDNTKLDPKHKIFVQILASFKYGRDDKDILGVNFQKDLFLTSVQLYPQGAPNQDRPKNRLQERIIRRTKSTPFPFWFDLPTNTPVSVSVQPADDGTEEMEEELPCGVQYEIKVYAAEQEGAKAVKGSTVTMMIRRLNGLTLTSMPNAPVEITENFRFMMSDGSLKVTATLNKEIYLHGESIDLAVKIENESTKSIRNVEIIVRQFAEICLSETVKYKRNIVVHTIEEGFPLEQGENAEKSCQITPVVNEMQGLAIDGRLKKDKANLAASTIIQHQFGSKENLGIIISYQVKVKMIMSMAQNVSIELPFILTHVPK